MRVLSLFDGISCGMVALERANIKVDKYVAYEIEKKAIEISKNNYKHIEHKGDVFAAEYKNGDYDLIIGGSPCTFWSIAKAGKGTRETIASGKGWELFKQYVRAIKTVKPQWFLYENNASMSNEIKECISKELNCEPIEIDSADFSAQSRKRFYWTNIPISTWGTNSKVLGDILEKEVDEKYYYNSELTNIDLNRNVCAKIQGLIYDMSARVSNPKFKAPTLTCVNGGHQEKKVYVGGRARKLTPIEYERLQTLPDNYTSGVSNSARYKAIGNGWTVDVIAHIFRGLKNI